MFYCPIQHKRACYMLELGFIFGIFWHVSTMKCAMTTEGDVAKVDDVASMVK